MAKEVIHLTGGISWWLSEAPPTMTIFQIFRCYNIIASTTSWPNPQDRIQEADPDADMDEDPKTLVPASKEAASNSSGSESDSQSPASQVQLPNPEGNHDGLSKSTPTILNLPDIPLQVATPDSNTGPPQYTLDITFGIALKTLWCLNKTVSLSTLHSTFRPSQTWSPSQLAELAELQRELDFPINNPEAFRASISNSGESGGNTWGKDIPQIVTDEIKENHVWAFHYSVILFFRRALAHTLPPSSSRPQTQHIPSQTIIAHTLTHLENIDALTSSVRISNTLWPGFIASAEAIDTSLRHRALAWFVRARRHGIGNIKEAEKLVREVWRRADRERYVVEEREGERGLRGELGGTDWRRVMREEGVWVMLT